jgi:hypothetical protein
MKHEKKAILMSRDPRRLGTLAALLLTSAYSLAAQAPPPKLTPIHQFAGSPTDGGHPGEGGSLLGANGALIGSTFYGGAFKGGTVYSLVPPLTAGEAWTETILHEFAGGADGYQVQAVALGGGGVIYGTTGRGGASGAGTAFSLTPPAAPGGEWGYAVINNFEGGEGPSGPLAIDGSGVIYGFSRSGGQGVVYALTPPAPPGGLWTESILHTFTGPEGTQPSGVTLGPGGLLYGTAISSDSTDGVVFSLTPPSSPGGVWTYAVLAYLSDGSTGLNPAGGVVIGANGVLYGTTANAAPPNSGTVFSLTPPATPGGTWTYSQLHVFTYGVNGSVDGAAPASPLVIGSGGSLLGVTPWGGRSPSMGYGTIFGLAPPQSPGGVWSEKILYNFENGTDGSYPGCVILSRQGLLFGVSDDSPDGNGGTVWSFTP